MFGWSLCDAAQPKKTKVANLRKNLLQRLPVEEDDEKETSWDVASTSSGLTKPDTSTYCCDERLTSQCSADSCFCSEFPSLTSTGIYTGFRMIRNSTGKIMDVFLNSGSSDLEHFNSFLRAHQETISVRATMKNNSSQMEVESNNVHSASLVSSSSSSDCWRVGSLHHAMAVVEHQEDEMSSLFDQLHELHNDLSSINDQVTDSLRQCRRRGLRGPGPGSGHITSPRRRCRFASSRDSQHSFSEDEMASIIHRILTRICELSLTRQEGFDHVPFII